MIPDSENKTQRLSLDLERNEDLAKLAADLQPGDKVKAYLSVVAVDDKTLTVELEEVEECDDHETSSESEGQESEPDASPDDDESPALQMMRGKKRDDSA